MQISISHLKNNCMKKILLLILSLPVLGSYAQKWEKKYETEAQQKKSADKLLKGLLEATPGKLPAGKINLASVLENLAGILEQFPRFTREHEHDDEHDHHHSDHLDNNDPITYDELKSHIQTHLKNDTYKHLEIKKE